LFTLISSSPSTPGGYAASFCGLFIRFSTFYLGMEKCIDELCPAEKAEKPAEDVNNFFFSRWQIPALANNNRVAAAAKKKATALLFTEFPFRLLPQSNPMSFLLASLSSPPTARPTLFPVPSPSLFSRGTATAIPSGHGPLASLICVPIHLPSPVLRPRHRHGLSAAPLPWAASRFASVGKNATAFLHVDGKKYLAEQTRKMSLTLQRLQEEK
jgi:hypothetical protein